MTTKSKPRQTTEMPTVKINMQRFVHPNAVRIEILMLGADEETRERSADAIVEMVMSLQEPQRAASGRKP